MKNKRPHIFFLCNFSNSLVRENVPQRLGFFQRAYYYLLRKQPYFESDYGMWVTDFISEFEKHQEFEFYIVAPKQGLKKKYYSFINHGIHYCFYNCSFGLFYSVCNVLFNLEERCHYATIRRRIRKISDEIKPDLYILCGAENPFYSISVLDVKDRPIYVLLQTLLNSSKRKDMNVGNSFRRKVELDIFSHAMYFNASDEESIKLIKEHNKDAVFLPTGFPTHRPVVVNNKPKEFDFVFFAKTIASYKGIEDVLQALSIVKRTHSNVKLNIIGGIAEDYQAYLNSIVKNLDIENNVHFSGQYVELKDTFENVVKATAAILPGKTEAFNSTIRESMLMGMPTICYEVPGTSDINHEITRLLVAPMGNINALADLMCLVLEQSEIVSAIAQNGKEYALSNYSNKAVVNTLLNNCQYILQKKL